MYPTLPSHTVPFKSHPHTTPHHITDQFQLICLRAEKVKFNPSLFLLHLRRTSIIQNLMGFPTVYYCVLLPGPLVVLLQILDQIRLFLLTLLHFLGLQTPSELPLQPTPDETIFRVSSAEVSYMPSTPASIKKRLPVVKFSAFRRRLPTDQVPPTCAICLCGFEGRQEVRVLGNCCHPFHKGCIDKWVDLGQFTCPLCRSRLLPRSCITPGWWSSTPLLQSRDSFSW